MEQKEKVIVLSRDGVINQDMGVLTRVDDLSFIPGSLSAIARLSRANYKVIVATNQPGLEQGLLTLDDLHQIHQKILDAVIAVGGNIHVIFFCPHQPESNCDCRKPSPKMLDQIALHFDLAVQDIIYVGDSANDLKAVKAVGCESYLVLTGQGAETYAADDLPVKCHVRANLDAVANDVIGRIRSV